MNGDTCGCWTKTRLRISCHDYPGKSCFGSYIKLLFMEVCCSRCYPEDVAGCKHFRKRIPRCFCTALIQHNNLNKPCCEVSGAETCRLLQTQLPRGCEMNTQHTYTHTTPWTWYACRSSQAVYWTVISDEPQTHNTTCTSAHMKEHTGSTYQ